MNSPLRVLHLEDDVRDTELLQAMLEAERVPTELTRVETAHDFVAALKRGKLDLILADYTLPSFDGISALNLAREHAPDVPFLFLSGTLGEDVAIEALKKGATDYVLKTRLARLGPCITRALREARESTERRRAEEALRASEQLARSHVEVLMRSLDLLATEAAPEKLIAEMLRIIGQRLRADSVTLWLRNPQDDSLRLQVMIENDKQVAPDPDHPYVKNPHALKRNLLVQEMLFTKSPAVCDDVEHDVRLGPELREYLTNKGRKSLLAIFMFMLRALRGFIGIQHADGREYRPEKVELAQALAHHVMIAAHEAKLGEERRHAVILEERTRMARDMHDTLAQGFTGVIVQLDTAVEALRDEEPEAAAKHIRRARDLARESLTEARRSVHALRPQALENASFPDALKTIITNTTAGTSLRSDFQLKGKPRKLQSSVEEHLLHIGQEALSNALKHACATTFQARLSFGSDAVRLELRDNGKGFIIDDATGGGIGLIGIKERAEQIGATLEITSELGVGTTITAVSPISSQ